MILATAISAAAALERLSGVITPWDVLQGAAAISGILALVGAVVIYVKGAAREITIKMLEEGQAARDTRIKDLTSDVVALTTKNEALTTKVEILEGLANSGDKIDALAARVDAKIDGVLDAVSGHHEEMSTHVDILHSDLGGLPVGIARALAVALKEKDA